MRTTPSRGTPATANSGDANGNAAWIVEIPSGSRLAQFTLQASDDSDLDLVVYRVASPTDMRYEARWVSAMASGDHQVTLQDPAEGSYLVVADVSDLRRGDDMGSDVRGRLARGLARAHER